MRYPTSSKQCPFPPPSPSSQPVTSAIYTLPHSPPFLLFVAGCQLCCLSICCRRLRLPLPSLLCTTLSMYFDNPPYLLFSCRYAPAPTFHDCCAVLQLKIMFSLLGERRKRGGVALVCSAWVSSVRFGCLLSIIWLIFHIRQNLFAVLAIYMGDTPCTINHRLANLVYDVERWRKEK